MIRELRQISPHAARPTLGALKISLHNTVERVQWHGLLDAAQEYDVNLLGFFGEALHIPDRFSAQANILYRLINPDRVDGLIVFSEALESYVDHQTMAAFLRHFHPLPVVSVERQFPGIPSILMDNYQAMRAMVRHLIEDHHYRRIAFIRGPIHHFGAQERYRAYCDALAEYHLPAPPELVTPPVFWVERRAMVTVLVEDRRLRPGLDFEAVVTAWDYQAFRAMEYLKARGVRIPADVAVVGFDNDEAALAMSPPLTTVQPAFYAMAGQAIKTLLDLLARRDVPDEVTLPTALVIRQSCGCPSQAFLHGCTTAMRGRFKTADMLPELQPEALVRSLLHTLNLSDHKRRWAMAVVEGFWREWLDEQAGHFLAAFEGVLHEVAAAGDDVAIWQDAISLLRQAVLTHEGDAERLASAEVLWHQARARIGETAEHAQIVRRFQEKRQERRLHAFEAALSTTFNVQGVLDVIRASLPRLGIPACYLVMYDADGPGNAGRPYRFPDPAPEWSRLLLAYDHDRRFSHEPEGLRFPTRLLLPEQILPAHRRAAMVVESLYFREEQLGVILFEVGPADGTVYEVLRLHISNALHGALLFAEVTRQTYILDTFMRTIPDRIYFKALDGRITRANRAHASQLGFQDPGEEIGKTDFDLFPREQAQIRYEQEHTIIRTGQPLIGLEEPDGQGRWVLTTKMPLRDEAGAIIGTFGISRDITHLKQTEQELRQYREHLEELVEERTAELSRSNARLNDEVLERLRVEQALRASEEQYRMLAENVKDGIVILQRDQLVFANAIFAAMLGYPANQTELIKAREPFLARLLAIARHHQTPAPEATGQPIELLTRQGRARWVDVEPTAIVWNSQSAVLLTIRDVTDRKQREQRLEHERARLEQENLNLRSSIRERYRFGPLVGKSPAMQRLYELIVNAAASDVNVLVSGESGTGKELIARTLHQVSRRKHQAFVPVNCASIPETLFEREFFGHRKGAFTGADRDAPGLFDRAHHGVLFLDEVTELTPGTQAKLLRVLQDGEYTPLGSNAPKQADVLIVAATNRDCHEAIAAGAMRQDFFYRLGIIEVCVPALRARKEDLPLLIEHILEEYRQRRLHIDGRLPDNAPTDQSMLPAEFVQALYHYSWPGNIRELQNVLQRYLATQEYGELLTLLGSRSSGRAPQTPAQIVPGQPLPEAVNDFEKTMIAEALQRHQHQVRAAAAALGIPLRTLYHKIKLYGLI
jgi:PAS domain S-box-containing protein